MTERLIRRPGIKLILIGGAILAAGIAGLIATPLVPGSSENPVVLSVLLLAVVGGGSVCLTGLTKRIVHLFKTTGFLGIKLGE
ncbi:hypothetical protein ACX80E_01500 [Arthrobacter sp. TMN-49]